MSDYYISGRSYEKEIGPLIQKIGEFVSAFYNINDIMQCLIEQVIHLWNNWIVLLKEQSAGFSIEGGTRRLIAAYFGIYSRLLCV